MSILESQRVEAPATTAIRPSVHGKFLFLGDRKLFLKGVTYGTFRPHPDGHQYPDQDVVERDFAAMQAAGINTVRTYTVPPRWLLDAAHRHGLWVMVGMPWEQHVAFLDDPKLVRSIRRRVSEGVRACAGHPAVLCYTIGNEIPAPIVRWHGRRRIESFLETLYHDVRDEDPGALTTYVNYPTTEYLRLPFVDFFCFNVYLETQDKLEAYIARLHNLSDEKPLVMAEVGLDSMRHGEARQAEVMEWQIRTSFASGCAGLFAFAWTDEWYRGGHDILDWKFGLTTIERESKPALAGVGDAFRRVPFPPGVRWPKISVLCCSYNGSRTIRTTLEQLALLEYPNYEVIVVNDGSTDKTPEIASEFDVKLISTENRGLSAARNTAFQAAEGEIVAYIDDDAYPDPHWLHFIAWAFLNGDYAGVGGPNLMPPGGNDVAECVANSPGGPAHVLITDLEAEHVPGCNMAFQKRCLEAIGGFDVQCRAAGDDVDCCWRLMEKGWKLGFSPSAVVWHHRRDSVKAYWKQQSGYGKAESILEQKWPERYNAAGHVSWGGRIYGRGLIEPLRVGSGRIYQGMWGSAPFQSLYEPMPGPVGSIPLMPEWYLIAACLAVITALGLVWMPLLAAAPLLGLMIAAPIAQAVVAASRAEYTYEPQSRLKRFKLRALTTFLHLLQPAARLHGRIKHGLTPWRRRANAGWLLPWRRRYSVWRESAWRSPEQWLERVCELLRGLRAPVVHGGNFDRWDVEVRAGLLGSARVLMAIEDHGATKQYARFRIWPKIRPSALLLIVIPAALAGWAALDGAWIATGALAGLSLLLALRALHETARAQGAIRDAIDALEDGDF
jgi:GT2 family glycosyltransferase